ncbi:unnamed protein product [Cladocopium goreaui]|uniref:Uncharacterized protein n=1 Tax=Cladocopium goreaui TaxID=2562237 RepID=A0A9P1CU67_9DINO|nr:unnamed protein product [Cladocopium goreaui]
MKGGLSALLLLKILVAGAEAQGPSQGFVWISQGAGLPPPWIAAIPAIPAGDAWLVWGSFSLCERTLNLPRFRHVCLPQVQWFLGGAVAGNMTYTPGRNLLYRHALEFEEERGIPFWYFVFADDSGEFRFNRCSTSACGNMEILPAPSESAVSFFHRLLLEDTPAVATPLNDIDDSDCLSPIEMRVCTSSIDHKVIAFHWSVHAMLLPYEEGFERISLFASQCIVNEVIDAVLPGHSVRYRMFQRPPTSSSSFPVMRPHYIRNLEPCLPQLLSNRSNRSYADSSVVKWLRPQLQECAASKLGASHMLQAGCQFGIRPNERCILHKSDYRTLDCLPWASAETCGFPAQGESRQPRDSGIYHVMRLSRSFGAGSSIRLQEEMRQSESRCEAFKDYNCAKELLCSLGMKNFTELRASLESPSRELSDAWSSVDDELKSLLWEKREQVDHNCDVCTSLLLGAFVPEDFLEKHFRAYTEMGLTEQIFWNWWWCVVAFLHQSSILLFEMGSVAPFEMLVFLTERSLPVVQRPSASPAHTADALSQLAASERPFLNADPSSECYLGLSVQHLIGATRDEVWRQGHAFAAQHYLAHCGLLELASPITAYFWYLFAAVGRNCSCSPPVPPPCGHRLRQVRRFRAMKPQKFASLVLRPRPGHGILQDLAF